MVEVSACIQSLEEFRAVAVVYVPSSSVIHSDILHTHYKEAGLTRHFPCCAAGDDAVMNKKQLM